MCRVVVVFIYKNCISLTMAHARFLSILLVILLLIPPVSAESSDEEREYISHPGNIPRFHDFETPQILPGEDGYLNFKLENRYDIQITDIEIIVEIYRFANIHESLPMEEISKPPAFSDTTGSQIRKYTIGQLGNDTSTDIGTGLKIKTNEETKQGTYFVRFQLTFTYNETEYIMKSRGHFTDEEWDNATTDTTNDDPGNINITKLGVNGIIPDTTFGVKKPWPIWPLYVLGALSVMFAGLAILTYMYEENTNPKFTRWVHKEQRKLGEYRALMKHETNKFKKKET
jgi:hypothetical protein